MRINNASDPVLLLPLTQPAVEAESVARDGESGRSRKPGWHAAVAGEARHVREHKKTQAQNKLNRYNCL